MKLTRTTILFLLVVVFLFSISISVLGVEYCEVRELGVIDLPEDFNFSVGTCSIKHLYYNQATANENGCFAVCMPHLDQQNLSEDTFKKQYIDLYHSDGSFWKELSFYTQFDYTIELTEKTLNIYFYSYVVKCDLLDDSVVCYAIPDGAVEESGLRKLLRQEKYTQGDWEYQCEESAFGYTKLIRNNGNSEEVLVNMPGQGTRFNFSILFGMFAAGTSLLCVYYIRKSKK